MARAIIPDDGAVVTPADAGTIGPGSLYVGTGGTLKIMTANGTDLTLLNVADGSFIPISVKRVYSSVTTASDILILY